MIVAFDLLVVMEEGTEDSGGYRQEVSRVDFHEEEME